VAVSGRPISDIHRSEIAAAKDCFNTRILNASGPSLGIVGAEETAIVPMHRVGLDHMPLLYREQLDSISLAAASRAGQLRVTSPRLYDDTAVLISLGLVAMGLGGLVYLTDRDGVHAALIPAFAGSHLFGAVGLWLPSLVHSLAFSLFTAATLPVRSAWRFGACAAWFVIDAAFELGQHPAISHELGEAIASGIGPMALGRTLAHYFVSGSFDAADIAAAGCGALTAAAVLLLARRRLENDHAS
jgi:hypothetical protein